MKQLIVALLCVSGFLVGCVNSTATNELQKNERAYFHLIGDVSSIKVTRTVPPSAEYDYDEAELDETFNAPSFDELYERDVIEYKFNEDGSLSKAGEYDFLRNGDDIIAKTKFTVIDPNYHYTVLIYKVAVGENEINYEGIFEMINGKGEITGGSMSSDLSKLSFDKLGRMIESNCQIVFGELNLGEVSNLENRCTYTFQGDEHLPSAVSVYSECGGNSGIDEFDIAYEELDDHNNWLKRTLFFKGTKDVAYIETRTITYYK